MDDLSLAIDLVTRAGALAAQMRGDGLTVTRKTSISDVVTAADHAAEALIVDTLTQLRPDDGVLGEEGSAAEGTSGRTWVIDPVDGTFNFASGMHYWCSALALRDADGTVLGAVHQPAVAETWSGGRDFATCLNAHPVSPLVNAPLAQLSLGSYIHPTRLSNPDILQPWLALVRSVATPRLLGSGSVDLASVATGRLGAWAQLNCPEWDWLPGEALVRAAGGDTAVLTHRGQTWYLAGNEQAVAEMVERIKAA